MPPNPSNPEGTWAVVIPTNRPDQFAEWFAAWREQLEAHQAQLIVCEDLDVPAIARKALPDWVEVYGRADWPYWIPRSTDMCRSFGMARASHFGQYILSIDDDTRPIPGVDLLGEYEKVFRAGAPSSSYFDVGQLTSFAGQMRGFPYAERRKRPVGLQAGGWAGVLDFDAATQLALQPHDDHSFKTIVMAVPKGSPTTICAMNMAWRSDLTALMWQLPLHYGLFNRWGDIWAGLFAKAVLDSLDIVTVINGRATLAHQRASDPMTNLTREVPGVPINERLWAELPKGTELTGSIEERYMQVTNAAALVFFASGHEEYAKHFRVSRNSWLDWLKQ